MPVKGDYAASDSSILVDGWPDTKRTVSSSSSVTEGYIETKGVIKRVKKIRPPSPSRSRSRSTDYDLEGAQNESSSSVDVEGYIETNGQLVPVKGDGYASSASSSIECFFVFEAPNGTKILKN